MEHVWVVGCEGPWERTYDSKEEAIAYLRKIKARHEGFDLDADLMIEEDKVELLLWHGQPGPERWLAFKREVKHDTKIDPDVLESLEVFLNDRNPDKIYGNIVIGNLDRPAGECLRFRHNENGAWFEYVPPQYTGQDVKVFKLDNPAVVHSLKQMLEGV